MIKNKVVSNAVWIISGRIFQTFLSIIVGMLTARYLGPSKYGLVNYASSLTAFFLPFMQLGLNSILVQEIINQPEDEGKIIGTSILMCLISAVICIGCITLFSILVNKSEAETTVVTILYSIILLFQAVEMIRYWFQAKLLSKYTSMVMFIAYAVVAVYRIWLLAVQKSIYWFAVVNAVDSALIAVLLLVMYNKLGGSKFSFSFDKAKELFRRSRYFIVSSLMITIFAQTDKIMLKLFLDETYTGYYSAAVTCSSYLGFVFTAILDSVRPSIIEGKKNNQLLYEKRVINLYSIVIYLSVGQCIMMTIFSKQIIYLLFGSDYLAAAPVLRLVVWFTTFSYIGGVRSIWILTEGLQQYLWIINLCGAIANIVLNACLIPILGMYGAAVATIVTQVFTNIIIGYIIKPIKKSNDLLLMSLKPQNIINLIKGNSIGS